MGQVRRVRAPRGVKVIRPVEYKWAWAYLNLAVNVLTDQLRWAWAENMRGVCIAPVIKQWAADGLTVLV